LAKSFFDHFVSFSEQLRCRQAVWPPGLADMVCPLPPLTLTFDHLTSKLVCESHLRWGSFIPNLGMLGFSVIKLLAMYATDGQTDRQTKATLIAPFCMVGGMIGILKGPFIATQLNSTELNSDDSVEQRTANQREASQSCFCL